MYHNMNLLNNVPFTIAAFSDYKYISAIFKRHKLEKNINRLENGNKVFSIRKMPTFCSKVFSTG